MAEIPVRLPLNKIYIGDTYEFVLKGFADDLDVAIDLTQFSDIKMTIRQKNERGPEVITLSISGATVTDGNLINGFQIEGASNNDLRGIISSENTKKFNKGTHVFDIQFVYATSGKIETWFKDFVNAEAEVTK